MPIEYDQQPNPKNRPVYLGYNNSLRKTKIVSEKRLAQVNKLLLNSILL